MFKAFFAQDAPISDEDRKALIGPLLSDNLLVELNPILRRTLSDEQLAVWLRLHRVISALAQNDKFEVADEYLEEWLHSGAPQDFKEKVTLTLTAEMPKLLKSPKRIKEIMDSPSFKDWVASFPGRERRPSGSAKAPEASVVPPVTVQSAVPFQVSEFSRMAVDDLISYLAEGLEYDKFDPILQRKTALAKGITFNDLIVVLTAYVFVGNNPPNLANKVRNDTVGKQALAVVNQYGIMRKKADGKTLTLARIAIAFSPILYGIRANLLAKGKIPSSGVVTSAPPLLQDVALSGVSGKIPGGDAIKDFCTKFNRVLTKAREKSEKTKSTEEETDAVAQKYWDLSIAGSAHDKQALEFPFNEPSLANMTAFYGRVKADLGL